MKRTSLFFKIYLGFWLTIIVTVVPFFFIERMIFIKPLVKEWHHRMDTIVQFQAEESFAIYQHNGADALNTYFTRLEKATGVKAYLFTDKGIEVTGKAVPDAIRGQLSTVSSNPARIDDKLKDAGYASRKIGAPNGPPFLFVAKFPHPVPPPPLPNSSDSGPGKGPGPGPEPGLGPRPEFGPGPRSDLPPERGPRPLFGTGPDAGSGPPAIGEPPRLPLQDRFFPSPGMPPHIFPPNFLIRTVFWLVVSAIICYLLARYLTSPIFKLGHAARQLADGNLSVRVSPELGKRRDELSDLANDFDGMADRIETLLTSQRNLLRDVSHELRSPLARLNVALELCRQNLSPEEQKHLDRIALETERLNDLIGQILTYNKINAGTIDHQKTKFDLSDLIEQVSLDANYENRSERVSIVSNESFQIEGNYDYLRRAIENIVRNAMYHTPEESPIEVSTSKISKQDQDSVCITVRDHGKGVPDDALPLIFKPFFKIAAADQHKSGAGLGLAISEAAIRFHNGSIVARNDEEGGLVVEITLPVAHPDGS